MQMILNLDLQNLTLELEEMSVANGMALSEHIAG